MFEIFNGAAPASLNNLFTMLDDSHHYKTRSTSKKCYYIESARTETLKRSFLSMGPKIWNSLPVSLKCLTNILQFKKQIRSTLLQILEKASLYETSNHLI